MADLFTLPELASFLQRDLDTASATLAREIATGLVQGACGPLAEADVTITLPVDEETGYVELPAILVSAVDGVTAGGVELEADTEYVWERPHPRVRLSAIPVVEPYSWPMATVTFTCGYPDGQVPPVAKAVALSVAARAYDNPGGLRTTTIDDYSETRAGSDDDLAGLTLTRSEENALRKAGLILGTYVTSSL